MLEPIRVKISRPKPISMNKVTSQALHFASTKPHQLFMGGRWQDAAHGETFEVLDPGTGKLLARVASGTAEDVVRAVAAGQEAFVHSGWATMPAKDRATILTWLSALICQVQLVMRMQLRS